jgi:hypothetical protein
MGLPFIGVLGDSARADRALFAGAYVTDGRRLFRVVAPFSARDDRRSATLEDCLTLEVRSYSPADLHEMGLRPVRRSVTRA